ncbi:amidohydrolase family protein [Aquincola sp. MAHUQ-54]|uniref:Amidohydrolase family protein n=1 Tax=Aquincola agrisoli TaxID=3119538 RepID=A0AAW9Q989_9BURK
MGRRYGWMAGAAAAALLAGCPFDGGDDGPPKPRAVSDLRGSTKDVTIELREGTNMAAYPSPDGRRIVFSAQGALWVIASSGGDARRITPWTVEPTAPVWSPDGKTIVFQNYTPDGNYHLWTVDPDGGNLKELTTGFHDDREPAWTPDGSALVFSSDRSNDGQYKIWRYTLASGAYQQVTTGAGAESNPVVSPNGQQIAFVDANNLYTVPATGGTRTLVGPGIAPNYTPDGAALVYQTPARVLTVGGNPVSGTEDVFTFPVRWMPDGRMLYTADGKLVLRDAAGGSRSEIGFSAQLTVRRPVFDKKKDRGFDRLTAQPVMGISAPALSPDGQSIAFVALNDVWVMRIGQAPVRLTDDLDRDGSPQWTRDGTAVYFSSEKGNAGALAIDRVEVATKARTRLGAIAAKSMVTPMMSPDGTRIAYTTGSGQLELWDIASKTAEVVIPQVSSQVSTPYWLPAGDKIVLVDNERKNNRFREGYNKLRVIDLATKTGAFHAVAEEPRQISDREEGAAAVSPDGTKVAFIMDSLLHVMPLAADGRPSGAPVAITTEAADLPSWSGDSGTLLYKAGAKLKTVKADGTGAAEVPLTLNWQQATGPATTIVRAGRLWDGKTETLQTDVDIVISGNRITAIRPHQAGSETTADRYVDASGLTVMPGLWDPHIHPLTLYQGGQFGQISALMLAYGITSTQSVAGPLHQSIEIRESLDAGRLVGPRVFVSPPLWEGNRLFYSFARTLRTTEVADREIAKAVAMGTDYMKSYVRAPIPVMNRIAQAALDYGIPTGTHMLAPGSAAGIAGTTHLSATQRMGYGWAKSPGGITYQDAADLHAKTDFHVVDTLFSSMALVGQDPAVLAGDRFALLVPPNFVNGLLTTPAPSETTLATIRRDALQSQKVADAGGLLAIGTDSPLVAPGIGLHMNLRGSGMATTNHRALQNVTINAARMSFVDADLGTVEVGKLADLVVVNGNPLQDLKAAADVRYVIKNGVTRTVDDILAPFRTPQALAARAESLRAWRRMCLFGGFGQQDEACHITMHAH